MNNLMPTYKTRIEHEDAQELNKWQQHFELLHKNKNKRDKKTQFKVEQALDSEKEVAHMLTIFNKVPIQSKNIQDKYPQSIKAFSKCINSSYSPSQSQSHCGHLQSSPYTHFKPLHLLKIIKDDVRVNSPDKKLYLASQNWEYSGKKFDDWPSNEKATEEETKYENLSPVRSLVASTDNTEFLPF